MNFKFFKNKFTYSISKKDAMQNAKKSLSVGAADLPTKTKTPVSSVKKWKNKFVRDLKTKEFLPIKGLFFLIYGAHVSLIPFLTLQARSLGITEEEVGIIYSFIPIAALIAPALSGMLADRIGNFRILLSIMTALAGLCGLLFLLVPQGRIIHKLPHSLPLEVTCSENGNTLYVKEPYQCKFTKNGNSFHISVRNCSLICVKEKKGINVKGLKPNLRCSNTTDCLSEAVVADFSPVSIVHLSASDAKALHLSIQDNTASSSHVRTVRFMQKYDNTSDNDYESDDSLCPNVIKPQEFVDSKAECYESCEATTPREQLCSNKVSVEDIDPHLTFYSHLAIRLLKEFSLATSMPLLDGAAVTILKEHKGDFGFQRMYCNIGMMVMTPISGTLMDVFSRMNNTQDYRPAVYMYCILKLVAAFIILFLNLEFKEASTNVLSDFSSLLVNPEIIAFLIATLLAGTCYGYIETFLFWLLEDLGADKQLMGITVTVGSVFGIPLLLVSSFILRKLGYVNTIVVGFFVYIIRLLGYTVIASPWWAMPFEALECVTVSLMVVSFVSYAAVLATPSTVVTLQGMYGGIYNGVGKGAGSLIGGYMIENLGIFKTFRVMAVVSALAGVSYFCVNLIIRLYRRKRDIESPLSSVEGGAEDRENKEPGIINNQTDKQTNTNAMERASKCHNNKAFLNDEI